MTTAHIRRVVLTGGPGAGKSSVLRMLQVSYSGQVQTVPESATILLEGGFPVPGKDIAWSLEWQAAFEVAIAHLQTSLEDTYLLKAKAEGKSLLVCDRGILDGAAYTPESQADFCTQMGLDLASTLKRYHAVIHLENLATTAPEKYGTEGNEQRFETLEEAQLLELKTRAAWKGHTNWRLIPSHDRIENKIDRVAILIDKLLAE